MYIVIYLMYLYYSNSRINLYKIMDDIVLKQYTYFYMIIIYRTVLWWSIFIFYCCNIVLFFYIGWVIVGGFCWVLLGFFGSSRVLWWNNECVDCRHELLLYHDHSILIVVLHLYHIFLYHTNTIELYIPGTVAITL